MKPSAPAVFKAFRLPDPYRDDDNFTDAYVNVNGRPLPLRLDICNHSPDGFEWSYGGSGPAQTALAILAFLYDDEIAQQHYQDFKNQKIAPAPYEGWEMTSEEVDEWLTLNILSKKAEVTDE